MSDRVDRENKIIRGYAVMSLGEARGHGFAADDTTLDQLVALGNAQASGVKSRVIHPERNPDGSRSDRFLSYVGKSKGFRREGDKVLADLHISPAAFVSPEGDYGTYLMERADEAEGDSFGASPEIGYTLTPPVAKNGLPAVRLKTLTAIAIVDDPATNTAFFSCLSTKEPDMADTAELEKKYADLTAKHGDLTAERDLLTEEAGKLKASIAKLEADAKIATDSKTAELSAAKTDAISASLAGERARVADILALCGKAGKADLAAKYVTDGTATADVQRALLEVLCAANKPVGEGSAADLSSKPDENAKYKTEFAALSAKDKVSFGDEAGYVSMRRIDDGLDTLTPKLA